MRVSGERLDEIPAGSIVVVKLADGEEMGPFRFEQLVNAFGLANLEVEHIDYFSPEEWLKSRRAFYKGIPG